MRKSINDFFDWAVIIVGFIILILALFGVDDDYLILPIVISSVIVLYYSVRAFVLFVFMRPLFDWHLIYGNFLRKICCFILLTPFALTGITAIFIDSPKELAYVDNLYECSDQGVPCYVKHKQESPNLFWSTYYHFVDPGNQHMTTSQNGRGWSALIAILGVFLLNGLLVSSIVGWIDSRKEKWLKGEVRYGWLGVIYKKVAIVIGANESTPTIIKKLLNNCGEKPINYVILLTNEDVEKVREQISSYLNNDEEKRVIIYNGQSLVSRLI